MAAAQSRGIGTAPKKTADQPEKPSISYHRKMARADVYLKVELDLDEREKPERLASEIVRLIRKLYGVRQAEVSSIVEREP